jgi:hypothetical protein
VGFAAAMALMVVAAIPLAQVSGNAVTSIVRSTQGQPYVSAWAAQKDLEVTSWEVNGTSVRLNVRGPQSPGDVQPLAAELAFAFGVPATLEVSYTPTTQQTTTANP